MGGGRPAPSPRPASKPWGGRRGRNRVNLLLAVSVRAEPLVAHPCQHLNSGSTPARISPPIQGGKGPVPVRGGAYFSFDSRTHRLEATGREHANVPVDAHSRPLQDDRRPGGPGCLQGRSSSAIDRAASDAPLRLNQPSTRNTLMVRFGSTGRVLFERRGPGGVGRRIGIRRAVVGMARPHRHVRLVRCQSHAAAGRRAQRPGRRVSAHRW